MADYIIPGHVNFENTYISIEIQLKGSFSSVQSLSRVRLLATP